VRVKICGITNLSDALTAAELGAAALGFIFVRSSRRWIDPTVARNIIRELPASVTPVGVFADAPREYVSSVIGETGLRAVQLHGDESPDDLLDLPVPVIKSFRVDGQFEMNRMERYAAAAFLLDTGGMGALGGTGKTFDWNIAAEAATRGRIILAGGLHPGNISEAIERVGPYAVDINSGVEATPGIKDHMKLMQLFDNIITVTRSEFLPSH
jgi:phosphoribosylanthranilate isomerase